MNIQMAYKKILVIDDDDLFLRPLTKFLTLMKYQVNIANSGYKALDLYESIKFDLIITDLRMEGMSGVEVINYISERYPDARIIVISGYVDETEFQNINKVANVSAIFEKPIDFEKLLKKIKEII
jgi:DNA-binding NtrC family response regulator